MRVTTITLCNETAGWTITQWKTKQKKTDQNVLQAARVSIISCAVRTMFVPGLDGKCVSPGELGTRRRGTPGGETRGGRRTSQKGDSVCLIFRPNAHVIHSFSKCSLHPLPKRQTQWGPRRRAPVSMSLRAIRRDGQTGQNLKKKKKETGINPTEQGGRV